MRAPDLSVDDFVGAMQRLLPRGRVWPRDPDANLTALLRGLAAICARQTERDNYLLIDGFPATSVELLTDWEATLGLPGDCVGELGTIEQRQRAAAAKLASIGGQSVPYLISIAATLGYIVTITEFMPWRVNMPIGAIYGTAWAYAWQVNAPAETITRFTCRSGVNEPLQSWGNLQLECLMHEYAPAHTIVLIAYGA